MHIPKTLTKLCILFRNLNQDGFQKFEDIETGDVLMRAYQTCSSCSNASHSKLCTTRMPSARVFSIRYGLA